jgi:molybdate transport system substrate-binding protein
LNKILQIVTSNSTRSVLDALLPYLEANSGIRAEIRFDSAKVMLSRIKSGESADIVVLGEQAVAELVTLGHLLPLSKKPFAVSKVGIGIRVGEAHPDINTVDQLRNVLTCSRAIAHTINGLSGMYVPALLEKLGIAEVMTGRIVTRPGGLIGRVVVAGEADIAVQQISELLAVPGLDLVGPLPSEVQKEFCSYVGIFKNSQNQESGEKFLKFLATPKLASLFKSKGLDWVAPSDGK